MHEALDTVIMVDDQDELDEIELQSRELEDTIGSSSSLHGAARALLAVEEDGGGGSSTSVLSCGIGPSSSCRDLSTSSSRGQVDELGLSSSRPTSPRRPDRSPGSMRGEAAAAAAEAASRVSRASSKQEAAAIHPQPPAIPGSASAPAADATIISASEKQHLIDSEASLLPPSRSAPSLQRERRPSREDAAARRDSGEGGAQGAQGAQAVETPQPRARRPSFSAIRDALPSLPSAAGCNSSPPLRPSDGRYDPVGGSTPSKELDAHDHPHAQAGGGSSGQGGGQGGARSPTCSSGERKGREGAPAADGVSTSDKYKERIARARRRTADRIQGVLPLTSPHALLSMDSEREDSPAYSQRSVSLAEGADMPPTDAAGSTSPGSEGEGDARRTGIAAASGVGREVTAIADERL